MWAMIRTSIRLAVLLTFCSVAVAQQPARQPSPALPAEVLGPPLIVWTETQKPQPVPQPLPPPERADQPQPAPQDNAQIQSERAVVQYFTGLMAKDSDRYVLKASHGAVYQIDDQAKAKPYEGKQVKIGGRLDSQTNVLHVASIELVS
jgi:hypothetical protein